MWHPASRSLPVHSVKPWAVLSVPTVQVVLGVLGVGYLGQVLQGYGTKLSWTDALPKYKTIA